MKTLKKERLEGVHEQTVPFHDCDPLGIVWHGHYLKYFEIARERLFDRIGLTLPYFRDHGLHLVVIESRIRHAFPLRTGELLRARCWFKETEQRILLGGEVTNLTHDRRAARAWITLVSMRGEEMLLETPHEILRLVPGP
ncbi:MAG: acyl-CoA thioesterase [Myxococcota bacterium]